MNESTRAPRAITWGRLLRIFALYVFVPVVLVGLVLWFYSSIRARADLDREIAWVRARNEPLFLSELNDYYTPDPGRPNMTAELEAALDLVESLGKKPEATFLPFVGGKGPEDIPPPGQPWNEESSVRKFIEELQPAIDSFRNAAEKKATARYSIDFDAGFLVDLSNIQRIRDTARFLTLVARVHSRDKNFDAAIEAIKCQIALGNTLDRQPVAISQLVRFAVYGIALGEIETLCKVEVLTDEQLAEMQTVSTSFDLKNAFGLTVVGERPFGYSVAVARRWGVSGYETAAINRWGVHEPTTSAQPQSDHPSNRPFWVRDAQFYLQTMRRAAEANEMDNSKLGDEVKRITRDIRKLEKTGILSQLTYLASSQLAPALGMISDSIVRVDVRQTVINVGIAVIRYQKKYGKLPAGIVDLVPEFLASIPLDPKTGAPLDYQVDGKSAQVSGQSFVFEVKAK
jgi:hypothetical protein